MALEGTHLHTRIVTRLAGHPRLEEFLLELAHQLAVGEETGRGIVDTDEEDFNTCMTWNHTVRGIDYWEQAQRTFRQCSYRKPEYAAIYD
jgi:hypothetical protein